MYIDQIITKKGSLDEILFRGRNKAYGAFELRTIYEDHLKRSILYFIMFIGGVSLIPYILAVSEKAEPYIPAHKHKDTTIFQPYDLQKPEEIKQTTSKSKNSNPTDIKPAIVDKEPISKEEKSPSKPEPISTEPVYDQFTGSGLKNNPLGTIGTGGISNNLSTEIFEFPSTIPEFPGGHKALSEYLGNKIYFTNAAKSEEEEGVVLVQFVINEKGQVEDIVPLQKLKYGLTEVALEAVKNMPKWIPGDNNGQKVKVRMELPIRFELD